MIFTQPPPPPPYTPTSPAPSLSQFYPSLCLTSPSPSFPFKWQCVQHHKALKMTPIKVLHTTLDPPQKICSEFRKAFHLSAVVLPPPKLINRMYIHCMYIHEFLNKICMMEVKLSLNSGAEVAAHNEKCNLFAGTLLLGQADNERHRSLMVT